ncbi:MAG: hypothetical protein HY673_13000 [Chloroflexi bacterium]|nr:hypothetical protein [Chloroflexota bacterium]
MKPFEARVLVTRGLLARPLDEAAPVGPEPDFITDEDYEQGLVEITYYPGFWDGDISDYSFIASGPPGLRPLIRSTVKRQLELQDLTLLSIDIKETPTQQFFGLPVWGNYAVRVFYHDSPFAPLVIAALIPLIKLALVAIGAMIIAWKVSEMVRSVSATGQTTEERKKIERTAEIVALLPESERQQAITELAKPGGPIGAPLPAPAPDPTKPPPKDPNSLGAQIESIGKVALVGFGLYMLVTELPSIKEGIGSSIRGKK